MGSEKQPPILELKEISKAFVGVQSLDKVSFNLYRGEVHAVVGENGAGKSTMIKVICGVHAQDSGEIIHRGRLTKWNSPQEARVNGISVIHQELNLAPNLSVAENVLMGSSFPRNRLGVIQWDKIYATASELLKSIGSDLEPKRLVSTLSVAQRQVIEIARTLSIKADIIIMDEPTASLTGKEIDKLFDLIRILKSQGVGIVYVSHRLEEIFSISDRVTVLRDGMWMATKMTAETTPNELIRLMVGRGLADIERGANASVQADGEALLEVKSLADGKTLKDGGFSVYPGEIVGISGLVGSGRSELLQAIFGASEVTAGEIRLEGKTVSIKSPRDAIQKGIALVPESRKEQSLFLELAVGENVTVLRMPGTSVLGWIRRAARTKLEREYIEKLRVKTPNAFTKIMNLSGGNQQKVILARWLMISPKILLLDEPTRGVDVGAKAEIYGIIRQLAAQGTAVVMVSSDLPEILSLSNRTYVMYAGRVVSELRGSDINQETIMFHATGGKSA